MSESQLPPNPLLVQEKETRMAEKKSRRRCEGFRSTVVPICPICPRPRRIDTQGSRRLDVFRVGLAFTRNGSAGRSERREITRAGLIAVARHNRKSDGLLLVGPLISSNKASEFSAKIG